MFRRTIESLRLWTALYVCGNVAFVWWVAYA